MTGPVFVIILYNEPFLDLFQQVHESGFDLVLVKAVKKGVACSASIFCGAAS
jgi:hypothetical protein